MTVVPITAPDTTESKLYATVTTFLEEARSGPPHSGMSETVEALGATIELSASRDWGVRFTRTLPQGRTEFRHLCGADLTLERAAEVFAELVQLS